MFVSLATFEATDVPQLLEWVDSPTTLREWAGTLFSFPLDEDQCIQYLASAQPPTPERAIFKALDVETNRIVGHIELDGFDWANRAGFICRVLVGNSQDRGNGIGRAIVRAACSLAFNELQLHRLAIGVLATNAAAIRCYEHCGFQIEGCYRDLVNYDGEYQSMITMSLLEHEWREDSLVDTAAANQDQPIHSVYAAEPTA